MESKSEARFAWPSSIIEYTNDTYLVADYDAHVIKRVDSDGTVTSFIGQDFQCGGGSGDASSTRICAPKQIAADLSNGNVFWFEGRYVYGYNASDNQISVIYDGNQDNFGWIGWYCRS